MAAPSPRPSPDSLSRDGRSSEHPMGRGAEGAREGIATTCNPSLRSRRLSSLSQHSPFGARRFPSVRIRQSRP